MEPLQFLLNLGKKDGITIIQQHKWVYGFYFSNPVQKEIPDDLSENSNFIQQHKWVPFNTILLQILLAILAQTVKIHLISL